jgi:hypothetical protein
MVLCHWEEPGQALEDFGSCKDPINSGDSGAVSEREGGDARQIREMLGSEGTTDDTDGTDGEKRQTP